VTLELTLILAIVSIVLSTISTVAAVVQVFLALEERKEKRKMSSQVLQLQHSKPQRIYQLDWQILKILFSLVISILGYWFIGYLFCPVILFCLLLVQVPIAKMSILVITLLLGTAYLLAPLVQLFLITTCTLDKAKNLRRKIGNSFMVFLGVIVFSIVNIRTLYFFKSVGIMFFSKTSNWLSLYQHLFLWLVSIIIIIGPLFAYSFAFESAAEKLQSRMLKVIFPLIHWLSLTAGGVWQIWTVYPKIPGSLGGIFY
jgi:hypothetical protein